MRLAAIVAVGMLSACSPHLSYIDPDFSDDGGLVASEVVDAALRHGASGSLFVAPAEQREHPFASTVSASLEGVGYRVESDESEAVPSLRYYVTKLYGGFLLRVAYASSWTARFFAGRGQSLSPSGPVTVQEFAG